MRSFPASLRAVLQQPTFSRHVLTELVEIDDPVAPIRRVVGRGGKVVEWPPGSGTLYHPTVGAFSVLADNLDGRRPRVTMTLSNIRDPEDDTVELPWSAWLQNNDPNGRKVTFRTVALNSGDADAEIVESEWYISGVSSLSHQAIEFHVGSPHDASAAVVPRIPIASRKCWAAYQRGFCTSLSPLGTCAHVFEGPDGCGGRFGPQEVRKYGPGLPLFIDARRRGVT